MIVIKNLVIGDRVPKICVPVMGRTQQAILESASAAAGAAPDLVEFRCDAYENVSDPDKLARVLVSLRKQIGELPLLMTFRSKEEGGEKMLSDQEYLQVCRTGIRSGQIDLIDMELNRCERECSFSARLSAGESVEMPEEVKAEDILREAHERGIPVIMSLHYFSHTPGEEEMIRSLQRMEEAGADILKLAVMPLDKMDVLSLLRATVRMTRLTQKPIITMSMGEIGKISRMIGAFTGSAVTFASAGRASAPGQIEVAKMREILRALSEE